MTHPLDRIPDHPLTPAELAVRFEEMRNDPRPPRTWWLSFADVGRCLGVVIIDGANILQACEAASALGINPGGEVLGYPMTADEAAQLEPYRGRLLTPDEARRAQLP